jgi:uncharacterized protein (DUF1015 family)
MPLSQEHPSSLEQLVHVAVLGRVARRGVLYKRHVARIRPFIGLLYDTAVTGPLDALTTPPYDVITEGDVERFHRASPFNVVRLIRGRDLPGDDGVSNRYTRAGSMLRAWREAGALAPVASPALFPYEFRFREDGALRAVRGIIAEVELEPFGRGITPHEQTMAEPLEDRLALLRAASANLSPVHAVYPGPVGLIRDLLDETTEREPARETTDEAGTSHRLWVHEDAEPACRALRREPIMIADGHHRYSVALAYQREMNARVGPGPWDRMMVLLVDAASERPPVLPIHRAVLGPPPSIPSGAVRVRDLVAMLGSLRDEDVTVGVVRYEDGELAHRIVALPGEPPAVAALHQRILRGVPHDRLAFLPGAVDAELMVRSGRASAAFLLPPTQVETVRRVIADGAILPEKSTYFWPKPRTGMVIRAIAG